MCHSTIPGYWHEEVSGFAGGCYCVPLCLSGLLQLVLVQADCHVSCVNNSCCWDTAVFFLLTQFCPFLMTSALGVSVHDHSNACVLARGVHSPSGVSLALAQVSGASDSTVTVHSSTTPRSQLQQGAAIAARSGPVFKHFSKGLQHGQ